MQLFKINTSSFKTRLIFSFVMAGLVTLILVVITITQMVNIVQLENGIVQTHQPTQVYLQSLKGGIQESMYISSTSFEEDKTKRRVNWNNLWENDIQFSLDSLRKLRTFWVSSQEIDTYRRLEKAIQEMKPLQNDCMVFLNRSERFGLSPGEEYYIGREQLLALFLNVKELIGSMMAYQQNSIEADSQLVEKELSKFRSTELVLLFIAFLVGIIIAWVVSRSMLLQIRKTRDTIMILSRGDLPTSVPHFDNELREIVHSIEPLVENFKKLKYFAFQVEKGEYGKTVSVFEKQGELGEALEKMRGSLQDVSVLENKRSWQSQGLHKFVEILRDNNDDLNKLGDEVIRNLTLFLNCNQGGLYLVDDIQSTHPSLTLVAYYAFDKKKFLRRTFDSREGLIGQAYQEKKLIHLTEIPEDYALISSGVGGSRPKSIIISPLIVNDGIFGIIEIASFGKFEEHQIEFIETLSENIAATFANVQMNVRTRKLLETSQQQAEQMRAQEEEMRQNVEELQATQEEMRRKAAMLEVSEVKGKAFFEGAVNPIFFLDGEGKIEEMNSSAEQLFNQKVDILKGKYFNDLVSTDYKTALGKMQRAFINQSKDIHIDFYLRESLIGKEPFYIAYLRDVTASIREQRILEENKKSLQDQIKLLSLQLAEKEKELDSNLAEQAIVFDNKQKELKQKAIEWESQNTFLNTLINSVPIPIAWKDNSLTFTGANTAFMHLAGIVSLDYLIGQNHENMPWASKAESYQLIEKDIWLNGNTYQEEKSNDNIRFSWIPIKNKAAEVLAVLIVQYVTSDTEEDSQNFILKKEIEKVKRAIKALS